MLQDVLNKSFKFVLLFLNLPIYINLPNLVANITLKIALPDTDVIKLDLGI